MKPKTYSVNGNSSNYVKFSWEKVDLNCEYNGCNSTETFDSLSALIQHLNQHIQVIEQYVRENPINSSLMCNWKDCNAEISNSAELKRHLHYHAHHSKLKCYGRNFLNRKNMLMSCKIECFSSNFVPELPNEFLCAWRDCGESFQDPEVFYRHVDIHAEDNPRGNNPSVKIICYWNGCSTKVSSLYKLKEHLRSHTQEKVLACPNCGGTFSSRTKFYDHITRQEKSGGVAQKSNISLPVSYQCGYCLKTFATERLLRDHTRSHVNQYKCPYCDMTTPTPSALRTHILYRHSEEKPFPCKLCPYRAKNQCDLRKHSRCHNRNHVLTCPYEECSFTSQSSSALCHHIKTTHTDKGCTYMCHICEGKFRRGYYLTRHLLKKHNLQWPSGHCRFRYQKGKDNVYQLQTVRYEWLDVSEAVLDKNDETSLDLSPDEIDIDDPSNCEEEDTATTLDYPTTSSVQEETPETNDVIPIMMICNEDNLVSSELGNPADTPETGELIPIMMICNDNNLTSSEMANTADTLINFSQSVEAFVIDEHRQIACNELKNENRIISLLKSNEDGSTVIEMAEVIAEG